MKTIYLIRHCQAEGQEPGADLTLKGEQQAHKLSQFFKDKNIDLIVTSPFKRAVKSMEPYARTGSIRMVMDSRLSERVLNTQNLPDWQEHLKKSFHELDYCLEGAESSKMAMERAISCMEEYTAKGKEAIAFVTHGNLLALILKHYDQKLGFEEWARLTNPDVYCVSFDKNKVRSVERIWK